MSASCEASSKAERMHTGRWFEAGPPLRCSLCPHHCAIAPGAFGLCKVRSNADGKIALPFYGEISSMAIDPMEKKPLYHFRPGSSVFSVGFIGCNLRCPFCQNWEISQSVDTRTRQFSPRELVAEALRLKQTSVAWTYSEPLVHIEYLLDAMPLVREAGLANVLVTNGCIEEGPAREVLAFTDAANIDLKCFSGETYKWVLGGDLGAVRRFIELCGELGVHAEATTLVVPGLNDSDEEIDACATFLASVSADLPWHLSAYHPAWRWEAPPTPPASIARHTQRARTKLRYVYPGNIASSANDTRCPSCSAVAVSRDFPFGKVDRSGLVSAGGSFSCAACGEPLPFR